MHYYMRWAILLTLTLWAGVAGAGYTFNTGTTSKIVTVRMYDSTGAPKTALAFGDMTIAYIRNEDATDVDVTEQTMTLGTWASGGWIEVDATNSPGVYQFGTYDASLADSAESVEYTFAATGALTRGLTIQLIDVDFRAGTLVGADIISVSGDLSAADNLELQYNLTGLSGGTFPANQDQVSNTATGAGGLSLVASTAVVTTGIETLTFTATAELDLVYHQVEDSGNITNVYYEFDVGSIGLAQDILWNGYVKSNGDTYTVEIYDWILASWQGVDILDGSNPTTPQELSFKATVGMTGTGANQGLVRCRFTSGDGTNVATDRILCIFTKLFESVGYSEGAIWVDTVNGIAGVEPYVSGTADKPVLSWANVLTLSSELGLKRAHVISGSTIALTGNTDSWTLIGDSWTLDLGGQSIANMTVLGAHVTGVGTSAGGPAHFFDCKMGAATIPPSFLSGTGLGDDAGTLTGGSAGAYVFDNCHSLIPGSGAPALVFTGLGSASGVSNRGWRGGATYTLDANITLTHEVLAGGATTITTGGAGDGPVATDQLPPDGGAGRPGAGL